MKWKNKPKVQPKKKNVTTNINVECANLTFKTKMKKRKTKHKTIRI